ncbi:hypothetical protein V5279_29030 [Bradyrhizobium sp. 26S5]|uniref:hypothetical protein n=1 Tax=Bradyrhizobium sp. 26S5 TaxID=3139729 RepID=UPI0030D618FE
MRIGVVSTHDIAVRRGILNDMDAGSDLFGGPMRNRATGTRTDCVRRLSKTVNAQPSAQGSTKGTT